jgi:RNA polymerase sigma-70 factor (ECF subfamily)
MLAEERALLALELEGELKRAELSGAEEAPSAPVLWPHEAALIHRLKEGDMSAFEELVQEYQPLVYALILRLLGDAEEARDATQETFLKIYRHFARFRGESSLKTWVCRIAINQARNAERWRRRRHRDETRSLDEPEEPGRPVSAHWQSSAATPESLALAHERRRQIESALAKLKKDFRLAVILRDIEDLSYEEIAGVLEISVGTVKSRIARGREMLRASLKQQAGAELLEGCRED